MTKKKPKAEPKRGRCPKCGSNRISGLVGSFWAEVDEEGNMIHDWQSHESSTEIGPERCCGKCAHEFIEGDEA